MFDPFGWTTIATLPNSAGVAPETVPAVRVQTRAVALLTGAIPEYGGRVDDVRTVQVHVFPWPRASIWMLAG